MFLKSVSNQLRWAMLQTGMQSQNLPAPVDRGPSCYILDKAFFLPLAESRIHWLQNKLLCTYMVEGSKPSGWLGPGP